MRASSDPRLFSLLCLLLGAACTDPGNDTTSLTTLTTTLGPTTTFSTTAETSGESGTDSVTTDTTTDTDPTTTDTDPTTTDTDPTTTDTDPTTTDTDPTTTDTDPTTTGDGCDDGDSGLEPPDDGVYAAPDRDGDGQPGPYGNFVPESDLPPISECNIFDQDCPIGEKCVPYASSGGSWDANKCVPVMGNGMVGEACVYAGVVEATDDCGQDSACWGVNNMGMGTCTAFCEGTPQAPVCPVGSSCLQGNNGSIAFCVAACNPLTQNCPPGEGCFWSSDSFACAALTQDIPVGQPCGYINDCAEGLMCVSGASLPNCNGAACCAEFCDLDCGQGVCSQPGTQCVAFYEGGQAPPGEGDIGVCVSP